MFKLLTKQIFIKIKTSINIKLSIWICASIIISVICGILVFEVMKPIHSINVEHVDYDKDRYDTEETVLEFIDRLYSEEGNKDIYIKENITGLKGNTYIVDENGNVKYKNVHDGYGMIQNINIDAFKKEINESRNNEFKVVYPLTINNDIYYLTMIKNLEGKTIYTYEISYVAAIASALILFIILIYLGIRKKVKYIEYISSAINEISKGNLNYDLKIESEDELGYVANAINLMEKNLLEMIEKERQNDNMQRELITNISHDLKTPLTIILGYLDIIRTRSYKTKDEEDKYIETTYEKALVLQKMILKLFELVKLSDKDTALSKSDVNINKLLKQVIIEYSPIADTKNIKIEYRDSQDIIVLNVDLDKMCRVFDNLINNAIKYSNENEKITVTLEEDLSGALISFRNKCENLKEEDLDKFFNRFYRSDKARNSSIEGSGIGLSIVKKIIELHNSHIWAELHDSEIWFVIRLRG